MGGISAPSNAYYIPRFVDGYLAGATREEVAQELWPEKLIGRVDALLEERFKTRPDFAANKDEYTVLATKEVTSDLAGIVPATVRFLGVWDTVLTLGRKRNRRHLGDRPSALVEHARQALALDEKRSDFRPHVWKGPAHSGQTLEQRWFAGVHSNVGGSYVDDGLANEALKWMLREARDVGLDLDMGLSSSLPRS